MGIGMVIVLAPKAALEARSVLPELLTIGKITNAGDGVSCVNHTLEEMDTMTEHQTHFGPLLAEGKTKRSTPIQIMIH